MKKLFTERQGAVKPRVADTLDATTRDALLTLVRARMDEEWFGLLFPDKCIDGYAYAGTDFRKLEATVVGYGLLWPRAPFDPEEPPEDGTVFDLIEFSYEHVAQALNPKFHSYGNHSHYEYDQEAGQAKFAADINRLFERNGMAFELIDGEVRRLIPLPLREELARSIVHTGDVPLDQMLAAATEKYLHRDPAVRRESIEKLWDAWERLKTIEAGKDKKASTASILDKAAAEPVFRDLLEKEALQLTDIGNKFMIRHSEVGRVPINEPRQVDYFFKRLHAAIWLLLHASGRLTAD
jgi:hypothetical protein